MEGRLVAQGWTPTSFETYRSALLDEGNQTLCVVTEHLYEGGNTRPDMYFISKFGEQKYKNTFNGAQRFILENSHRFFNMKTAVEDYDISLNFVLQEYLCGLSPKGNSYWHLQGSFENMLSQVHEKRNDVAHKSLHMNEYQLNRELLKLQELYGDILDHIERKTHHSIEFDRLRIMNSLKGKFPDEVDKDICFGNQIMNRLRSNVQPSSFGSNNRYGETSNSAMSSRREIQEESGIQTFGKIALGVAGAAVAAWGVSKIVENGKSSEQEKRRKQKSSNEEECSIM